MKTATLIALIGSVLEMLMPISIIYRYLFSMPPQFRDAYRSFAMIGPEVTILLFTASLSYFFLVLYKNQKS